MFRLHRQVGVPMKMEQIQCSETLAYKIQDARELPRRKHTTFRTGRKFEIKNSGCMFQCSSSSSSVGPVANTTDVRQPGWLIVLTLSPCLFGRSHVHRQVSPRPQ